MSVVGDTIDQHEREIIELIARLKELHEKASPPNWFVQEGWTLNDERFCHIDGWTDEATHGEWLALKRADADLTVEMRNNLCALLRYVEELERDLAFYKGREKSICQALPWLSDGGKYRNDIICAIETLANEHKRLSGEGVRHG